MPENLTIQVGADTTKLRADLLVAQAELRKFSADVNKNVRAGDSAGAAASAASGALAAEQAIALKGALAASNAEALTFSRRLSDSARELEHIRGQLGGGFGGLLGNVPITPAALGIGLGLAALGELGKLVGETAERAHRMEVVSEALGVSTGQMRDWTKAAGAAHVPAEILDQLLERLAISAEKAGNEQRKLRVETAQLLAKDGSFGIVSRGGLSTPPPKPSGQFVDGSLFPNLDDPKFRDFAKAEMETFQKAQERFRAAGQIAPPLPDEETFLRGLRNRMGSPTKEGEELRANFAKSGGDAPARDFAEMLKRLTPDFKDTFTKHNIELLDTAGKLREFKDILVGTTVAMSKMDDAEKMAFAKELMSRQVVKNPQAIGFMSGEGEKGGGIFNAPARGDRDVESLSGVAKAWQSAKAAIEDAGLSIGGAVVRGITDAKGITESLKETRTETLNLGTALDQLGNEPGITTAIGDAKQLEDAMRDLGRQARSAAAAVGAALGGGTGGSTDDTGLAQFASGGYIRGPGTGTSDSILARLSNGEYVMSQAAVDRIGVGNLDRMNFGRHLPRYASGGAVGSISSGGSLGTVHLTLDGQTHSLRADRQNFEGIVQYARTRRLAQIAPRPANAT